jgi:hypothetical protein
MKGDEMRLYLAGSYSRRKELLKYANELEAVGHIVTARWLRLPHERQEQQFVDADAEARLAIGQEHALRDIADLLASDTFVLFADSDGHKARSKGGKHFEMGFAHGIGLSLCVIGGRPNVFCTLPEVHYHSSWQDFLVAVGNEEDAGLDPHERDWSAQEIAEAKANGEGGDGDGV